MNFKPSIYNFFTTDDSEDYLVCNLSKGKSSIRRIPKKRTDIIDFLKNKTVNHNISDLEIKELLDAGLIVRDDIDEVYEIKRLYNNLIYNNKLNLILMTTGQCNFRCKYCYEDFKLPKMSIEVQDSILKYIQSQLDYFKNISIEWFGGEPLMGLDVIRYLMPKILHMCNLKKSHVRSGITTNGYLLTPNVFDELYKMRIFDYQITIDGSKEEHDKQRVLANGAPTYDTIINNLNFIKNNKDKYPKVNIVIRVNVTKDIANNLSAFINVFKKYFSFDKRFSVLFKEARDLGGLDSEDFKTKKLLNEKPLVDVLDEYDLFSSTDIDINSTIDAITPLSIICYASYKNSYVIGPTGLIHKCTVHFDKKENTIGNLQLNGKLNVNEYKHGLWYFNKNTIAANCEKCNMFPVCYGGGCTYVSHIKNHIVCNKCEIEKYTQKCLYYLCKWMNPPKIF